MWGLNLLWIRLKIQLHPTEPANYTGSYTTVQKQIVDTKIAMSQSANSVITYAVNIARGTAITTAMQMLWLLKPKVCEEQE
jgi:hypothetical protein